MNGIGTEVALAIFLILLLGIPAVLTIFNVLFLVFEMFCVGFGLIDEAVARHGQTERERKLPAARFQKGIHSLCDISCVTAIGGDGENVCFFGKRHFFDHFADGIGHISVVYGENESDRIGAFRDSCQMLCGSDGDHVSAQKLCEKICARQGISRGGKNVECCFHMDTFPLRDAFLYCIMFAF